MLKSHDYFLQVFDLSNWENSLWAYYPGVSGWPGSKHYGDTAELLEDGKGTLAKVLTITCIGPGIGFCGCFLCGPRSFQFC